MADVEQCHDKAIACIDRTCNETSCPTYVQGSHETVREYAGQNEMEEHGIPISSVGSDQPEEKTERIEDGGFKMGPKGDSTEDIGIPIWNRMVNPELIMKKLFHGKVEADKIISDKPLSSYDDLPEEKKSKDTQEGYQKGILMGEATILGHDFFSHP